MKQLRQVSLNKRYVYYFTPANVQLRLNRYGGCFDKWQTSSWDAKGTSIGPLSWWIRDWFGHRQIAREVLSSPGFVQKVIDRYNEQNTSLRAARVDYPRPQIDEAVLEYVEVQKVRKPSIYSSEIQQRLLLDGVVHPANLPSVSQINKVIRKDLVMTRKKLLPFHLNPQPLRQQRLMMIFSPK